MTFYELKGRLGCGMPIFPLTTGEMQRQQRTVRNTCVHHRCTARSSCPSRTRSPILLGGSGGEKKKAKTEQREAGVKATGRKERGLIWRQVDTGGPQARPPSEPQTVDQRQAHVLRFPEEARARAVCNNCLLFLNGLHFNQWASSPKNILYPGKIKCTPAEYQVKPCNLETM